MKTKLFTLALAVVMIGGAKSQPVIIRDTIVKHDTIHKKIIKHDRRYSVSEIDNLRSACYWRVVQVGVPYYAKEVNERVEGMVRTYMDAGITADDLRKEDKKEKARLRNFWNSK